MKTMMRMGQISYSWVILCGFLWMVGCQSNVSEPQPDKTKIYFLNPADSRQVDHFLSYVSGLNPARTTSDGDQYNNWAIAKYLIGEYDQALEYNNQALTLRVGDAFGTAKTQNNLAAVYQALGDYTKALELYKAAAEQLQVLGKAEWYNYAQANYAKLAASLSSKGGRVMIPPGQDRPIPVLFAEE
jgi:tetratricopeptide (TPR) repeat protein